MSLGSYTGRLSRKRLTGLLPFGWSRVASPSASRLTIQLAPPGGRPADIPRRAALGAPKRPQAACGLQQYQYRRPAAGSLRSLVSAGRWPARGARRAPSLSGRGVFPASREPHAVFATVARFHPAARVRFAQSSQSSPGPSLRSGCGFRAAPGWPLHLGSTWLL
jgi:hypothetical protein